MFVAVGGGGLIGGIGAYLKAVSPQTEIVGCWPENSPVMHQCLLAGSIVEVAERPTLSESTAGGLEPGSVTFDVCRRVIDRSVLVTEDEILRAMRLILETRALGDRGRGRSRGGGVPARRRRAGEGRRPRS